MRLTYLATKESAEAANNAIANRISRVSYQA